MMSVRQSARRDPRLGYLDPDIHRIETWFIEKGVPQFVVDYLPPRDNVAVLLFLILIGVAFDLVIQPWVRLDAWFLLIAPTVLVSLALLIRIAIFDQASSLNSEPVRLTRSTVLRSIALFLGTYLLGCLVFWFRSIYWSDLSIDFLVAIGLLWVSARLFRIQALSRDAGKYKEWRRLYILVVGAIICFAFEGSLLPSSTVLMDGVVSSVMPTAVPVPQGLAALLVTVIILFQSRGMIRNREASDHGQIARPRVDAFFPAIPLLILALCFETTVFPYVDSIWPGTIAPLVILAVIAPLHILLRRPQEGSRIHRLAKWPKGLDVLVHYPGLILFVVLYLVACPAIVGVLSASQENQFSLEAFGRPEAGRPAFIRALAVNLFYLLLAAIIAGFGLDRVAVWASKEAWTNWRERISTLGRGLSILLAFTTFLLLTAEIWETLVKISTGKYLALLGSILVLTGAFHLLTSVQHLARRSEFDSWSDVVGAATSRRRTYRKRKGDIAADVEVKDILSRLEHDDLKDAPEHPLGRLERINGLTVMMTYEILFFIPVMLLGAVLFFVLGHIVVPPAVAATWVYGDGTPASRGQELANLPLIQQPWTRVAVLLAAFSVLYLAVELLSDSEERSKFFDNADRAIRRRLAARLAYREVLRHRMMVRWFCVELSRNQWCGCSDGVLATQTMAPPVSTIIYAPAVSHGDPTRAIGRSSGPAPMRGGTSDSHGRLEAPARGR